MYYKISYSMSDSVVCMLVIAICAVHIQISNVGDELASDARTRFYNISTYTDNIR